MPECSFEARGRETYINGKYEGRSPSTNRSLLNRMVLYVSPPKGLSSYTYKGSNKSNKAP